VWIGPFLDAVDLTGRLLHESLELLVECLDLIHRQLDFPILLFMFVHFAKAAVVLVSSSLRCCQTLSLTRLS